MPANRTQLIDVLQSTSAQLAALTAGIDDAALDFRANTDDWTAREILAHLVDDEIYVMRTRMERIIKEELPDLAPHDEQKWYRNRNKRRDALAELLADFELQRRASLGMIAMLRESDWQRQGFQPEYGQFSAETWLDHWAEHDTVHLRQISTTLSTFRNEPPAAP